MKKTHVEKFLGIKNVMSILGSNFILTAEQYNNLGIYFNKYGYRKSQDRYTRLAWFLRQGVSDLFLKESNLLKHNRMSEGYFKELYGDRFGKEKWDANISKITQCFPSRTIYWTNKGFSLPDAIIKVKEHQTSASLHSQNRDHKKFSIRCKDYWTDKGYSHDDAAILVRDSQRRGLAFYIDKYGDIDGLIKYNYSCKKRINTWSLKSEEERKSHYLKTLPAGYNTGGQEMQAIGLFLEQNKISKDRCMFGAPKCQFYQWISGSGFRRYDLAVFEDVTKKKLQCIMEFHGPGHINFSDYTDSMDSIFITVGGKTLPHLGTYGQSYRNDTVKKRHIKENFPDVSYYVFWSRNLKDKDLKIK